MKITMNVGCTPDEARAFLGLLDLKPMQDELMQEMRNHSMAGIAAMDAPRCCAPGCRRRPGSNRCRTSSPK
jgi:hypothetical protein